MTSSEYVSNLYRLLLGRQPDDAGLQFWVDFMAASGDPTEVLAGILDSPEYRGRNTHQTMQCDASKVTALAAHLSPGRVMTVVDVGAQMLPHEEHAYLPLLNAGLPCQVIGFDPLADRMRERAEHEKGYKPQLLPHAIGDGGEHTFYINNVDATSSMYPLNEEVITQFADMCSLSTVKREKIPTHTLDEVLAGKTVDFLKLDIQGFELRSLQAALTTLSRTAVVHCETEFRQIYSEQPLFPQVHSFLTAHNFTFVDFFSPVKLSLKVPSGHSGPDMLVFADAVFFRGPDPSDPDLHIVQALIAILVYGKPVLAEWLLHRHDLATGTNLASILAI
jgi:FkbM family methyltransferase